MFHRVPSLFIVTLLASPTSAIERPVHHDLRLKLQPERGWIEVEDRITVPAGEPGTGPRKVHFFLHENLAVDADSEGIEVSAADRRAGPVPVQQYRVNLPADRNHFTLHYHGRIQQGLTPMGEGWKPRSPPRQIAPDRVYLDSSSAWYPQLDTEFITFSMEVRLPSGWDAVSQGRRTEDEATPQTTPKEVVIGWAETEPQDDLYLIAGRFHRYHRAGDVADAEVYLRKPDRALAQRYLALTDEYLELYQGLLGPYPYAKFAAVENFWETGLGMPSFTLLGPRVMRLPFILYSSYPHEILHNWLGNAVYVDYAEGNWSEGLTAYLADHLLQEQRGRGLGYRRSALQKYADYVAETQDFPLIEFRARHSEASQAVGYSKSLLVFHMLRLQLGDPRFVKGLRKFYNHYRFRRASFGDLQRVFETVSGEDLEPFFSQWLTRPGAPHLVIRGAHSSPTRDSRYRVTGWLEQTQPGPAYQLRIPVAVTRQGQAFAQQFDITMDTKRKALDLTLSERPLRLDVDPEFDLFRRLDRSELPPSLGQVFGAPAMTVVLPADAPAALKKAYETLAQRWAGRESPVELRWDHQLEKLPADRAIWILGWQNRFRAAIEAALEGQPMTLDDTGAVLASKPISRGDHALVLSARGRSGLALGWLGCDQVEAIPGLTRKLPHYGKYSYLAFTGQSPENVLKGQWQVDASPLIVQFVKGQGVPRGSLASRHALDRDLRSGAVSESRINEVSILDF